ncbi:MAG: DUF4435 domain-containing protein [Nitrospirales bacterium]
MVVERKRLGELLLKYKLEPTLRDIYVEGESDVSIIRWILREQGNIGAVVYHVLAIDVPVEKFVEFGQDQNNRGRVIVLAHELARARLLSQATCIVDRDFDAILNRLTGPENLLFTDYSSMEMYFFNNWHLSKLFSLVLGRQIENTQAIQDNIAAILQELFLIRLANHLLGLGFGCMTMTSCCQIKGGKITFDLTEYMKRYMSKNGGYSHRSAFDRKIDECRAVQLPDPRQQMHGHDFLDLLAWYIRKSYSMQHFNEVSLKSALMASLEASKLTSENLFVSILCRVQS